MSRIAAACIAIFGLANAIAGFVRPELDANSWWIDLRGLPDGVARACVACACGLLLAYALFPEMTAARKGASLGAAAALFAICLLNCATYYALVYRGACWSG